MSSLPKISVVSSAHLITLCIMHAPLWDAAIQVYDPRQGPQPGGYLTAQDYLADTKELVQVRVMWWRS
jgi:hypothetical protein